MPYRAVAAEILAKWREAERKREAVRGTPAEARLDEEMLQLRRDYVAAVDAARRAHLPEPAGWPADAVVHESLDQSAIGSAPPSDTFSGRPGAHTPDGGLEAVYGRLVESFGEAEADSIFAQAKSRVGGAPLESWLTAVADIANERIPRT